MTYHHRQNIAWAVEDEDAKDGRGQAGTGAAAHEEVLLFSRPVIMIETVASNVHHSVTDTLSMESSTVQYVHIFNSFV